MFLQVIFICRSLVSHSDKMAIQLMAALLVLLLLLAVPLTAFSTNVMSTMSQLMMQLSS